MSILLLRTLLMLRTLIILLTTSVVLLPSQVVAHDGFIPLYYWVHFTDKNNTPYSLEQPEVFLSPRAIILSGNKAKTPNNDYGHGIPDFRKASQYIESSPARNDSHVKPAIEIFPNPVSETSVLRFSSPASTKVHVRVMNMLGQCILSFDIHASPGINEIRLAEVVREVIPGVYYFSLSGLGVGRAVIVNKKAGG